MKVILGKINISSLKPYCNATNSIIWNFEVNPLTQENNISKNDFFLFLQILKSHTSQWSCPAIKVAYVSQLSPESFLDVPGLVAYKLVAYM